MSAVCIGNGISGIGINLVEGIILASLPPDRGDNAFKGTMIYFSVATFLLVICVPLYWVEKKHPLMRDIIGEVTV